MKLRISPQTVLVLTEFLQTPSDWKYGYDINRNTGLKSGTLYPILMRLADRALVETRSGRLLKRANRHGTCTG
jgi:PadR family transcriptional regulator PadR